MNVGFQDEPPGQRRTNMGAQSGQRISWLERPLCCGRFSKPDRAECPQADALRLSLRKKDPEYW